MKQHSYVTYLCYVLDDTLSGEPMTLNSLNKMKWTLKLLYNLTK